MPLGPREEIERLKREISVQRLAEARGIKLKRSGKELIGLCPFHKDTNPSLNIDPAKNVWHCKGACGEGGDVIKWVMRAEGVSFKHAMELLREDRFPLAANPNAKPPRISTVPKLPAPVERSADDRMLLLQVVSYYHESLKQSPDALKYLEGRGLQSAEMIDEFRLGFANRTLGYRLPEKNRVAGAELRGRLQKLGIYRESGHEHFNGSVVIPIFDLSGQVVQMYGRKITPNLRAGTPDHLYLPGPHRGVWNEAALSASKDIILCEALIDALTFWCGGYRNVTTIYGVNGFTEEVKSAFQKHGTKRIYIAYDRDEAGEGAAQEHAAQLMEMGIECFRVQFPKGMDANEYALKVQPAPKALGVMLNRAAWLGKSERPSVAVIEPVKAEPVKIEPPAEPEPQIAVAKPEPQAEIESEEKSAAPLSEEKTKPAAKEENAIPLPTPPTTEEPEKVFLLAAEPEAPRNEESAPMTTPAAPGVEWPLLDAPVEIHGDEIVIRQGDRRYRVRGLGKNMSYELLKVNLLVSSTNPRGESAFHVDTFDLYSARQRTVFLKQAAEELGVKEEVIRRDLGHVLLQMEALQEQQIKQALQPEEKEISLDEKERVAAIELLRDPRLLDRILGDFEKCGMVGEETNKKISYLAAVSRLLEKPLAVVVQSSSAAGKSSLIDAVLDFMPEEQRESYSAMTGQSLFYMGEKNLKHKILAIAEQQGAEHASYPLKLLQSEGVLKIASTGKDPVSGKHVTHDYTVEGPVMILLTTTAIEMDEELLNRCLLLTVNEDPEQTKAIHQKQREAQTREGLWAREDRSDILKLHRNAQRLLRPLRVANEHAPTLSFPYNRTRTRRDHTKFLTLINAIALLYQYQRPVKTDTRNGKTMEYIEATEQDVELARQLVNQVLPPSLDEVPPQTRRLLFEIEKMVSAECARLQMERGDYRFSRRTVRHHTQAGDSALKKHLHRLEELEYLIVHRGGRGQSFVYELDFELDEHGNPVVPGLGYSYDGKKSRVNGQLPPSSHTQVAGVARVVTMEETRMGTGGNGDFSRNREKNAITGGEENPVVPLLAAKPNGRAKASGANGNAAAGMK